MKRAITIALFVISVGVAYAQPGGWRSRWGTIGPGTMANLARHHQAMMYGVPAPYHAARDPLPDTAAKLIRGREIFHQSCAGCHGTKGYGDGVAADDLVPPPADLAWLAQTPVSRKDSYMLWAISEGGHQFGSDMPAFKTTLSRNDIWSVIGYVRAGLPQAGVAQ